MSRGEGSGLSPLGKARVALMDARAKIVHCAETIVAIEASTMLSNARHDALRAAQYFHADACEEYAAAAKALSEALSEQIVVEPAPGDACGNTRLLPDGKPCPGCRACS